jgi:hypothetical protein
MSEEKRRMLECTFKPQTRPLPRNHTGQARVVAAGTKGEKRFKARETEYERRARLLREREAEEMQECTFKPKITKCRGTNFDSNTVSRLDSAGGEGDEGDDESRKVPVEERLMKGAGMKWVIREKARRQQEEMEMAACTFNPKLVRNPGDVVDLSTQR